jgi:hypothetical protein
MTLKHKPPVALVGRYKPCPGAKEWLSKFDSLQEAWDACERPDWMMWWLNRIHPIDIDVLQLRRELAEFAWKATPKRRASRQREVLGGFYAARRDRGECFPSGRNRVGAQRRAVRKIREFFPEVPTVRVAGKKYLNTVR